MQGKFREGCDAGFKSRRERGQLCVRRSDQMRCLFSFCHFPKISLRLTLPCPPAFDHGKLPAVRYLFLGDGDAVDLDLDLDTGVEVKYCRGWAGCADVAGRLWGFGGWEMEVVDVVCMRTLSLGFIGGFMG